MVCDRLRGRMYCRHATAGSSSEAVKPDFHLLGEGTVSLSEVLVAMADCIYIRVRLEISLPLKTMLREVAKQNTRCGKP